MKVYPDVDFYILKTEITGKQPNQNLKKNAEKSNLLKTERVLNTEI